MQCRGYNQPTHTLFFYSQVLLAHLIIAMLNELRLHSCSSRWNSSLLHLWAHYKFLTSHFQLVKYVLFRDFQKSMHRSRKVIFQSAKFYWWANLLNKKYKRLSDQIKKDKVMKIPYQSKNTTNNHINPSLTIVSVWIANPKKQ
jgi:hypothetical protein